MLGHGAYLLVYYLAVLEHKQRRDAADAEFGRSLGVGVHVDFANDGFAFVLAGQLFYHRPNHAAGAAPLRPEVHEDWLVGVDDFVEVGVGDFDCFMCHGSQIWLKGVVLLYGQAARKVADCVPTRSGPESSLRPEWQFCCPIWPGPR